jgi:hypothetical protein
MSEPTKCAECDGLYWHIQIDEDGTRDAHCTNCFEPWPDQSHAATPLPAPDPMDEVVGRVQEREASAMTENAEVLVSRHDLRALLAAYQSVREENARLKFAVDLVLDAAPKNVLHRTGGTE